VAAASLATAARSLLANPLRSFLALLGVAVGSAALIVLVGVGKGSSAAVESRIDALGTNLLTVAPSPTATTAGGERFRLEEGDVKALENRRLAPAVKTVAPILELPAETVSHGTTAVELPAIATEEPYLALRAERLAAGAGLEGGGAGARVVVVGAQLPALLGIGGEPIGQTIDLDGVPFRIAGVLAPNGSTGLQNEEEALLVPLASARQLLDQTDQLSSLLLQARSRAKLGEAQTEVVSVLAERHHLLGATALPFTVLSQGSLLQTATTTSSLLSTLLIELAAIALVLGAVGVANVMLVAVSERRREIGVRKALGARPGDVLAQFLLEAVALCLVGGVIGIGAGIGLSHLRLAGVRPVVAPAVLPLSLAASLLVGLLAGTHPALRAARLTPLGAIRQ